MLSLLKSLQEQGVITQGDYYFAQLIADKQKDKGYAEPVQNLAILLAALCNWSYTQGNTCCVLDRFLECNLFGLAYRHTETDFLLLINEKIGSFPVSKWQSALAGHIAFTQDPENQIAPLAFQFGAIYFYRAWQDEFRVAQYIKNALKNDRTLSVEPQQIRALLNRYFPQQQAQIDWQKVAVATAVKSPFSVITGGPGTGKTTTVTRLLCVLQELFGGKLHIKLVAPTGKATARLTESIENALAQMPISDELRASIPKTAETLHRLLGVRPFTDSVKYHTHNPLQIDVLVVDETSMIDLPMMAKLVQALKPETRLILLGDQAQLASVEAGAVLGEIAQFLTLDYSPAQADYIYATTGYTVPTGGEHSPLRDAICHLTFSRRFRDDSGIKQLAEQIQQGKGEGSVATFAEYPQELHFHHFDEEQDVKESVRQVVKSAVENYRVYLTQLQTYFAQKKDLNAKFIDEKGNEKTYAEAILDHFNSVRFLTALRASALGVEELNHEIALALRAEKLLWFRQEDDWYIGKPIMITENDHNVKLYNGDIGLCLAKGKVWFGDREVSTSRIPAHEPAFMMTIHKSQGSEFEHTVMVLPTEPNPVLSRELVFTGVTRAKNQLSVFANEKIWQSAVRNTVKRQSGLGKLLQEKEE